MRIMKLHSDMTINGVTHHKGDEISAWKIYPFFLVHMLMFGLSGFFMAYGGHGSVPIFFLYMHGGIAIVVYVAFYFAIFGKDEVKWMFINAGLGLFGIIAEIDLILNYFNKTAKEFAWYIHIVPFVYYILYTFLLRQMFIDVFNARENEQRLSTINTAYVLISIAAYFYIYRRWR